MLYFLGTWDHLGRVLKTPHGKPLDPDCLEACKGGVKVGSIKDPLYQHSSLGYLHPTV